MDSLFTVLYIQSSKLARFISKNCNVIHKMDDFHTVLTKDPVDGGYVVTVPEIPGLVTEGDTVQEATRMAKDAIETYLSYQKEVSKIIVKVLPGKDIRVPAPA